MINHIPTHLQKYISTQNYEKYTAENQATWRFLMRQLVHFLKHAAHPCYVEGLAKTGIKVDEIPRIDVMSEKLSEFGWQAIPVSGFIPPAAFMEFQALGFLPIAADMRSLDHIRYTPAPDIVHEAAGHAPILVDPDFSAYLKQYAEIASKAIISSEDLDLYTAIRELSDIKENPSSSPEDIQLAEKKLSETTQAITYASEASLLGRMNWWTAEYGLVGPLENPKIFGAGLLSSLEEARTCLNEKVKKIPLTLDCIDYTYDITELQPQLFVAPNFNRLSEVLEQLSEKMAYKQGGRESLNKVIEAKNVNTVEYNSGLQVSGLLSEFLSDSQGLPIYLKFSGPCQLSYQKQQLDGHGKDFHAHGFGSPIGLLENTDQCLSKFTEDDLNRLGIKIQQICTLKFKSGVVVTGHLDQLHKKEQQLVLASFSDCTVKLEDQILFDPSWGQYDMAIGQHITSAFSGPSDRAKYGELEDFQAIRVPQPKFSPEEIAKQDLYLQVRNFRNKAHKQKHTPQELEQICELYFSQHSTAWLIGLEIYELTFLTEVHSDLAHRLRAHLEELAHTQTQIQSSIQDGLAIADQYL